LDDHGVAPTRYGFNQYFPVQFARRYFKFLDWQLWKLQSLNGYFADYFAMLKTLQTFFFRSFNDAETEGWPFGRHGFWWFLG
jgi:SNF2 family DNA or RNA helicase